MKHKGKDKYRKPQAYPSYHSPESARGDRLYSVKRFQDDTRFMAIFEVLRPFDGYPYPGELYRRYLTEAEYEALKQLQKARCVRISRYYRIIEGHIIPLHTKREKRRKRRH